MKYLLDSHTLLWATSQSQLLSETARREIAAPQNIIFVSLASLWELRLKESLGKLKVLPGFYRQLPEMGYELLPLSLAHIETFGNLPWHHKDPFDRMLVAQAMTEQLTLMTRDATLLQYEVSVMKV